LATDERSVAVVGAGIVGVACALALQRSGARVTLIDRGEPGHETSFGNAGVVARSSLIPFNQPGLWASLPTLARNRSAQLRYRPGYLARQLAWGAAFLAGTRAASFESRVAALDGLIRLSLPEHLRLLDLAGARQRWRPSGWIHLFRSDQAYAAGHAARAIYARYGIATQTLDPSQLAALEPQLRPVFTRALWIQDSASVDSPLGVVQDYAALFVRGGGTLERSEIVGVERDEPGGWRLRDASDRVRRAHRVVLALGPWSAAFIQRLGLRVPMVFERGYHMHYAAQAGAALGRPVYDVDGGYVLSPMVQGLRLTTGVELNDLDAAPNVAQLTMAERSAREAFPLGERLDAQPWLGRRPTLPDCLPVIGAAPHHPGLWFAFGHQHVGFGTAPGTASLLAAMMTGERTPIDARPFRPERFIR